MPDRRHLVTFALLFANAFGAVATAYALTGSSLSIVPILLFAQIRGAEFQRDAAYFAFRETIDTVIALVRQQFYQILLNRA